MRKDTVTGARRVYFAANRLEALFMLVSELLGTSGH